MQGITKHRQIFPITLSFMVLSGAVCVASIVNGLGPKQLPWLLTFIAVVNLSSFVLLLTIVHRVRRLRTEVTEIATGQDLTRRLIVEGNDELFDLANNINVMLANLEETHEYLIIAREAAEAADQSKALLIQQLRRREQELSQKSSSTSKDLDYNQSR